METHHRISRQVMFMEMAEIAAKRSSCARGNVGCVITDGANIRAIGYNGPAAGEPHCTGSTCERTPMGGCSRSVHAEINALNRIDEHEDWYAVTHDLYTTSAPCYSCAFEILKSEYIRRVFYRHPYRETKGLELLIHDRGMLGVFKVTASGMIIDERTKEFVDAESLR
jgi:dCMP deaminase